MARTGFDAGAVAGTGLARGYQRAGTDWAELVPDGYGAFAPMGRDLQLRQRPGPLDERVRRRVPARVGAGRRGAPTEPVSAPRDAAGPGGAAAAGRSAPAGWRGSGRRARLRLRPVRDGDPRMGRLVFHSGGYPGYGSHMRWHPSTGLGVIVLANSTYAAAHPLAAGLMEVLLRGTAAPRRPGRPVVAGPAPAPGGPWPETLQAQREADQLLRSWDDQAADQLFAPNVALDEPYSRRREEACRFWERIGRLLDGQPRPAEFDSPAHCRWWLAGEHGTACAEIKLTAQRPPRVQLLALAVPPAPGGLLWQRTMALVDLLNSLPNGPSAHWPADLPVAGPADTGLLLRLLLRMASAWAGACRPGPGAAGTVRPAPCWNWMVSTPGSSWPSRR